MRWSHLRHNSEIKFRKKLSLVAEQAFVQLNNGRNNYVRGKVINIDRLKTSDACGVVDYKSSLTQGI